MPGGGGTKIHKPRRDERWEGKDKFCVLGAFLVTRGKLVIGMEMWAFAT